MKLRFHTTAWDVYRSLLHRVICTRGTLTVQLAVWAWAIYETAKKTLFGDAHVIVKVLTIIFSAFIWAAFLFALLLAGTACTTFFARKEGMVCEHTLQLLDDGLEEETHVNRSVHRWPLIKGMKKAWGMWAVFGLNGMLFVFDPSRVVEGDPNEFARMLNEKRG